MTFDFLKNITINKVEDAPKQTSKGRVAQEKNPKEGLTLRLFKDGSIYPSQELVDKYNLEYTKDKSGYGFDVFNSKNWSEYPSDAQDVVFITSVSKKEARVDLFSTAREVNGELTSVMNQGSKTFGLELIPMLESTYGVKLFEDKKYVDLQVVEDVAITQDIVYVPKMVNKGEHKGMMTTERRENVTLYPLAIISNNEGGGTADKVEELETVNEEELA